MPKDKTPVMAVPPSATPFDSAAHELLPVPPKPAKKAARRLYQRWATLVDQSDITNEPPFAKPYEIHG